MNQNTPKTPWMYSHFSFSVKSFFESVWKGKSEEVDKQLDCRLTLETIIRFKIIRRSI